MSPNPSLFDESFSQFPNMFDQPFPSAGMFNTGFPSMPVSSPYQPKQTKDEQQGERIIPIKVVNTNSQNLMNNYSDQVFSFRVFINSLRAITKCLTRYSINNFRLEKQRRQLKR